MVDGTAATSVRYATTQVRQTEDAEVTKRPQRRNVPLELDVHEQAVIAAESLGMTLKDFVQEAIREKVSRDLKEIQKATRDRTDRLKRLSGRK